MPRNSTTSSDYKREQENNDGEALKVLEKMMPDLATVVKLMLTLSMSYEDIQDYLYNVSIVKSHGYGNVQISIVNGHITKLESVIRTVKMHETDARSTQAEKV